MGVRDRWHRQLVHFGLAEDEAYYGERGEVTAATGDRAHNSTEPPSRHPARRPGLTVTTAQHSAGASMALESATTRRSVIRWFGRGER